MGGKWQRVETDVLVVGGGSAGCMAAIKAKDADPTLDVTVMEKGVLTSSTMNAGTAAAARRSAPRAPWKC